MGFWGGEKNTRRCTFKTTYAQEAQAPEGEKYTVKGSPCNWTAENTDPKIHGNDARADILSQLSKTLVGLLTHECQPPQGPLTLTASSTRECNGSRQPPVEDAQPGERSRRQAVQLKRVCGQVEPLKLRLAGEKADDAGLAARVAAERAQERAGRDRVEDAGVVRPHGAAEVEHADARACGQDAGDTVQGRVLVERDGELADVRRECGTGDEALGPPDDVERTAEGEGVVEDAFGLFLPCF